MLKKILASIFVIGMAFPLFISSGHANTTYQVERGDTLWLISVENGVSFRDLLNANGSIANPALIYPGQQITIPSSGGQSSSSQGNTEQQVSQSQVSQFEREVVRLTNVERQSRGLSPLQLDEQVSQVARLKSQDMADQGYFSHQSPRYGSPFDMLRSEGVSYQRAGENIAAGQSTPAQVVQGWMNSQGHRENILNSHYTHIGVGHVEGGSYRHYWTQMFISK
ncbi:hypothetical protein CR194_00495 [Salipaludibacillus keqinensis]|uniref:LysM domain-containing protein n=2 Tax=Salipaludibacillus keqinensis TaxID=2045207 RepID=A0A323TKE4_9BACI|nr:CAP domain-containing protein [Salipaludibacillus keqinensis]PYZ95289.1 hypothetical protein CR194_00495 [Salipaludibacillus keqinensis]